jgi:hypothetical protein
MLRTIDMHSRIISIAIASTFLAGVAARFGARFWKFGQYYSISIAFCFALAMTLAVLMVRGNVFYRWLTVAISAGLAYRSLALFVYLNSKGTPGGAYLLPGVAFSICSVALFALLLTSHQQDQGTIK